MKYEIKKVIEKAIKDLELGDFAIPEIEVDYPKNEAFGDFTTNMAMGLSRILKKNPMEIAEEIASALSTPSQPSSDYKGRGDVFEKIEVVAPGYINFYLSKKYLQDKVGEINEIENKFGDSSVGKGIKINNEFISANPTGPLHLGNGRGGFLGDAISNVLRKTGHDATNEYYINDAGEQVMKLGHSVLKDEEAVYGGEYIDELNKKFPKGDVREVGEKAAEIILEEIVRPTVASKMKIKFDVWFSEKKLYDEKYVDRAIEKLEKDNLTYKKDDAVWLKTTEFGDDKDRVLIKKDGQKTYFASDCGYILSKKERGFEKLIEIWGADHHGYISRFRAAAQALGYKKGDVRFLIVQLVKLMKGGKEVRMSKRAGNVVYIDELLEKVGLDVARFFFLMYSPDTHMNFDLGLAEERSEKNPVYYVQYAHARICSILRKAKEQNLDSGEVDISKLVHEKELSLIRELNKFPELIEEAAKTYEVHKLPYYAIKLADKFHSFYNDCLVLDEKNLDMTLARLELVKSVRIVLAETLRLIGVSAPNKM